MSELYDHIYDYPQSPLRFGKLQISLAIPVAAYAKACESNTSGMMPALDYLTDRVEAYANQRILEVLNRIDKANYQDSDVYEYAPRVTREIAAIRKELGGEG